MSISKSFLDSYVDLAKLKRKNIYNNSWLFKVKKRKLVEIIKDKEGIDLLWHSILFNLFSKILYDFFKPYYKYCNDHIHWQFDYFGILNIVYREKLKNFIDEDLNCLPDEYRKIFYISSNERLLEYILYFVNLFKYFEKMNSGPSIDELILIIEHESVKEEFSDNPENLSFKFYQNLFEKLKEGYGK